MEHIEAMLCAYIEGDLDQAGRTEIERHLRENPQHQKMIEDLMSMRTLRDLPRVRAPMEVSAAMRGRVERNLLLDDNQPFSISGHPALRGWQYLAIAAVFLLTTGVGIVVYQMVLPTLKPAHFTQVTPSDDGANPMAPEPLAPAGNPNSDGTRPSGALAAATPSTLTDRQLQIVQDELRGRNMGGVAVTNGTNGSTNPVYWVVDSPDPANTRDKINSFLNSNNITFTAIKDDLQVSGPAAQNNVAEAVPGATLPRMQIFGGGAAPTTNPTTRPDALALAPSPTSRPAQEIQIEQINTPAGYVVHGITRKQIDVLKGSLQTPGTQSQVSISISVVAAPSTTQPSDQNRIDVAQTQPSTGAATQKTPDQQQASDTTAKIYQDAHITVQQSGDDQRMDVVIFVQPPVPAAPATQPTTQPAAP